MKNSYEHFIVRFNYEQVPSRERMTVIRIRAVQQINQKTGEGR